MSAFVGVLMAVWSAGAQEPPDEVVAWVAKTEAFYKHYKSVEPGWEETAITGPTCPSPAYPLQGSVKAQMSPPAVALWETEPAKVTATCDALRPVSWRVKLELIPVDQRVFSPIVLRVSRVEKGAQADAAIQGLMENGAAGSKAFQALVPSGPYLVEVNAPCGASGLWAYDLADAIDAIESVYPAGKVTRAAVSPCGRIAYAWTSRDEIRESALMPREYWGLPFPEVRDKTLGRKTVDPFAD